VFVEVCAEFIDDNEPELDLLVYKGSKAMADWD
jgi:hypothetical protein